MQGKTLYTILLSIIAVLALALAVIIIFMFTAFNGAKVDPGQETKKPLIERAVPKEEQAEYKLYASGGNGTDAVFNLRSTTENSNSYLMASVSIIFDGGKKNKRLEERQLLFDKNLSLLKQATIKYFLSKSFEEIQEDDAIEKAQATLKASYNDIISADSEDMIVIDVIFDKWIKQESTK